MAKSGKLKVSLHNLLSAMMRGRWVNTKSGKTKVGTRVLNAKQGIKANRTK